MKFMVQVMPRPEALDPQGRAVQGALDRMGYGVKDCRVGKVIILELETADQKEGLAQVTDMAAKESTRPSELIVETVTGSGRGGAAPEAEHASPSCIMRRSRSPRISSGPSSRRARADSKGRGCTCVERLDGMSVWMSGIAREEA